jgi:hypothetical protein
VSVAGSEYFLKVGFRIFTPDSWPHGEEDEATAKVIVKSVRHNGDRVLVVIGENPVTLRFDRLGRLLSARPLVHDMPSLEPSVAPQEGDEDLHEQELEPDQREHTQTRELDDKGKVISTLFLYQFLQVLSPIHPVKPGDVWITEVTNPVAPKHPASFRTTFIGREVTGRGVKILKFRQTTAMRVDEANKKPFLVCRSWLSIDAHTHSLVGAVVRLMGVPQRSGGLWIEIIASEQQQAE